MTTASRARNPKQPTPVSGRPRQFGELSPRPAPFNLTEFQALSHRHTLDAKDTPKAGGFGLFSKAERRARRNAKQIARLRQLEALASAAKQNERPATPFLSRLKKLNPFRLIRRRMFRSVPAL